MPYKNNSNIFLLSPQGEKKIKLHKNVCRSYLSEFEIKRRNFWFSNIEQLQQHQSVVLSSSVIEAFTLDFSTYIHTVQCY